MATGLANLLLGADYTVDDPLCDTLINHIKNHWRMADPCTNLTQIQPGMIVSDSDDEKLYHYWAAECRMILQEHDNVFIVDPGGGGHYTTIQAALDAENAGGELFLIAPNDYTDDTIDFSADNQCVRGMGQTPQADVHAVDAAICDFGAWTGCRIEDIKMRMTDPTTAKDMITGSGSLRLRWCHLEVNVDASGPAGADQPTCIDTTGEVIMTLGSLIYTNSKDDAAAIKAPIRINAGADVELRRVNVDIDGSNQALATTLVYGTAGLITLYRCHIDVADNGASNTIGLAYSNVVGGVHEFMSNWVYVSNTSNDAFGLYLLSTENVRSMYNHYHITGDEAFSFSVAVGASVVSQFDDIIATDGPTGTIANISWVSSEVDGEQSISKYLNFNPAMLTGEWGVKFMSIADGAGDPTYSLMAQSDAEGIALSSDLRIGLDPSLYTLNILPRALIGNDLNNIADAHPTVRIWDSGATDNISFYHDDVSGFVSTNAGDLMLNPAGNVNLSTVATTQLILPLSNDPATPTLAFGDGDTGFYESADDEIEVSINGNETFTFRSILFEAAITGGASIINEATSAINPGMLPNKGDVNTGIGWAAADQLSLIAGGVEGIRIKEDTTIDVAVFGNLTRKFTVTTDDTDGNVTHLIAAMLGGHIRRGTGDQLTAARTDVMDTAANIVGGIPGCIVGSGFEFSIANEDSTHAVALGSGAGVTIIPNDPSTAIPTNSTAIFLVVVTNIGGGTEAVNVYALGASVH